MRLLEGGELFPGFDGLLEAANAYAAFTGARFDGDDFGTELGRFEPQGPTVRSSLKGFKEAREEAAVAVKKYKTMTNDLLKEYERAYRMTVHEAALCAMVAAAKELELLPAETTQTKADITVEDVKRDSLKRLCEKLKVISDLRDSDKERLTTLRTASFLADFGVAIGLKRFDCPDDDLLVKEFYRKLSDYTDQTEGIDCAMEEAFAPYSSYFDFEHIKSWARQHPEEVTNLAMIGAGIIGLSIALFAGLRGGSSSKKSSSSSRH